MKILHLLHAVFAHAFYTWALQEIHPLHCDVPDIVRRRAELADKLKGLYHERS